VHGKVYYYSKVLVSWRCFNAFDWCNSNVQHIKSRACQFYSGNPNDWRAALYLIVRESILIGDTQTYPSQEIPNIQSSCHSSLNWTEFTLAHRALTYTLPSLSHQSWSAAVCVCLCVPGYFGPSVPPNHSVKRTEKLLRPQNSCVPFLLQQLLWVQTSRSNADLSLILG